MLEEIIKFILFCLLVIWFIVWFVAFVGSLARVIRNVGSRRKLIKTMENSCAGCVHLYFDNNDKPKCDLQWGGWCAPSMKTYYHPSDY